MDFFAMKRKKLQSYCKKHGIPANLKNVEMAERLSLIYQGEKNENPAPPRLEADKGELNAEVIDLDSDSGADDVEALDTVAGKDSNENIHLSDEHKLDDSPHSRVKSDHNVDSDTVAGNDSNEKTNLSDEHKLDEEPDQFLTTSPESEVKSDHIVDSDTVAGNESNEKTNLSDEHKLDEETDQFLTTSPESEVKSDHKVDSGSAVGNADVGDMKCASLQKTSRGREESDMKLAPEGEDIGSSYAEEKEETMQMIVNTGKIEDNQELHHASPSDDENMESEVVIKTASGEADVLEDTSGTETVEDEPESIMENVSPKDSVCLVEPVKKMDDNDCVMDETAAMCLDASTVAKNTDENSNVMVEGNLDEVHSSSFKDTNETPDWFQSQETLMDLSPNSLNNPKSPTNADIGICDLEEDLQIGSNKENIDPSEEVFHANSSVVDMSDNEDLTEAVSEELDNDLTEGEDAKMDDEIDLCQDVCGTGDSIEEAAKNIVENTNLTVEDMLDAVRSSNFDDSSVQLPPIDQFCEVDAIDLDVHNMVVTGTSSKNADTSIVKVVSEELANNSTEEEVEGVGDKFDFPEDVPETGNGSDEGINQASIDSPHGSNVNNADLLHASLVESSSPLVGGQVQKSDDHVMPGGDYDLGNCGFAVDVFCSHDKSIAAEDTDEKTVVSMENHPYESHAPSGKYSEEFGKKLAEVEFDLLDDACATSKGKDEALKSSSINSLLGEFSSYFDGEFQKSDDKIMHCGSGKSESEDYTFCFPDESIAAKDTDAKNNVSTHKFPYEDACEEEMLGSSEKTCMVADPEECFGFSPNDLEASATKGFADGTCFDPTTLGDVVIETCNMNESMQVDMKENSQEEGRNFFENSDIGGVGAEDENLSTEMASRKRKSDAISDEEVKGDELVPTVPQTSEMDSSNFSLQPLFASDPASGDEDAYQKKLDSPSKATPMIHKENIKFDKKEEVRSIVSRNKFTKRQPLQDL